MIHKIFSNSQVGAEALSISPPSAESCVQLISNITKTLTYSSLTHLSLIWKPIPLRHQDGLQLCKRHTIREKQSYCGTSRPFIVTEEVNTVNCSENHMINLLSLVSFLPVSQGQSCRNIQTVYLIGK